MLYPMDKVTGIIVLQNNKEISTNSMYQNTTQKQKIIQLYMKFPQVLMNIKVHFHIHCHWTLTLDQLCPLHTLKLHLFEFYSNYTSVYA